MIVHDMDVATISRSNRPEATPNIRYRLRKITVVDPFHATHLAVGTEDVSREQPGRNSRPINHSRKYSKKTTTEKLLHHHFLIIHHEFFRCRNGSVQSLYATAAPPEVPPQDVPGYPTDDSCNSFIFESIKSPIVNTYQQEQ